MARYAYRYRSVLGRVPDVGGRPCPVGVGTLEWAGHVRAIMDTMLRCHGNMPAGDNEEITSLSSPSAFQTTTWWHARALLAPGSPLRRDGDDHLHLELVREQY